jgi:peptidoglycan-associated lipoprotein
MAALVGLVVGCGSSAPPVEQSGPVDAVDEMPDRSGPSEGDDGLTDEQRMVQYLESLGFETVYFDTDKWNIREDARDALKKNAAIMADTPDIFMTVEGHCDERNTVEYNLALGERRAQSVRDYLVRLGVSDSRIKTISYGEERPAAFGHDDDSWQKNRRAEFKASK